MHQIPCAICSSCTPNPLFLFGCVKLIEFEEILPLLCSLNSNCLSLYALLWWVNTIACFFFRSVELSVNDKLVKPDYVAQEDDTLTRCFHRYVWVDFGGCINFHEHIYWPATLRSRYRLKDKLCIIVVLVASFVWKTNHTGGFLWTGTSRDWDAIWVS